MTKFKDIREQDMEQMYVLLLSAEERTTRGGKPFCVLSMTDGDDEIQANAWDTSFPQVAPYLNQVVEIDLQKGTYHGNISYTVRSLGLPENSDVQLSDFVRKVPIDSGYMWQQIYDMLRSAHRKAQNGRPTGNRGTLCGLAMAAYDRYASEMAYYPAAKSIHHNIYGGFLYHTYRMMKAAAAIAEIYPDWINIDLLYAGTALHDIGKLKELDSTPVGTSGFTPAGNLLGHTVIGIEMVSELASEMMQKMDEADRQAFEEQLMCLKHVIAAHHGQLEFGAPVLPAIPEAMVIHELDMIDSRMYIFEDAYKDQEAGTVSEKKVFALGNARLYKPLPRN